MKRNSVFNNFNSENKYSSKKNYAIKNGFLDSQNEFANEFYEEDANDKLYNEIRDKKEKVTTNKPKQPETTSPMKGKNTGK